MATNKICTSIEQSEILIELGIDVDTADMVYLKSYFEEDGEYNLLVGSYHEGYMEKDDGTLIQIFDEHIPAWSLSALLELMPDKISINNESYYLSFTKKSVEFRGPITWDGQKAKSFEMDNILDAAFEMVCWLKENGKI